MLLLQEFDIEIRDKKSVENSKSKEKMNQFPSETNSLTNSFYTSKHPHHGLPTSTIMWQHLNSHLRYLVYTRRNSRAMPSITFRMTLTFRDSVVTKSSAGAFLKSRSIRSFNFAIRHLEEATMDQYRLLGKCWTVAYTGLPF
ncbi:hypothetical protein CR513_38363, partial [Mucuna pruriens]